MNLNKKELPIVTSAFVERNGDQCKCMEKVWTIEIQMRFLIISSQVIVLIVKYVQHDIFEFPRNIDP